LRNSKSIENTTAPTTSNKFAYRYIKTPNWQPPSKQFWGRVCSD